jgi:membrane protease YdiL (CAAX protease family)
MRTGLRRALLFLLALLGPVALLLAFTMLGEFAVPISPGPAAPAVYAAILLLGAVATFVFVRWTARLRHERPPVIGGVASLTIGAVVGLLVSAASGGLYYLVHRPELARPLATALRPSRFISNLGPASLEEVGFRAGVVQLLSSVWGTLAGLLGGSVPFGVLHLLGVLFGRPPSLTHVIGVSAAGWLLSLLYLQCGLLSAVACHWVWNSLASFWFRAFQLPAKTAQIQFEGAWTTDAVLLLTCAVLHLLRPTSRGGEQGIDATNTKKNVGAVV